MNAQEGRFPDWKKIYEEEPVESMPWFQPQLDEDVDAELKKRGLKAGEFLDIGTGPATQALELKRRGFQVTATDLSPAAIKRAKNLDAHITFLEDDILETKLKDSFDFAMDRGCFHVLPPEKRATYAANVRRLLKPGGLLFLKCFSAREPEQGFGPYRFTPEMIKSVFGGTFEIEFSRESEFKGPREEGPKALFSVLKRI